LMHDLVMYLTGDRMPYYFSIHDRGKDRQNPHAHPVIIDQDIDTGKRVLLLSDSPKDRAKAGLVPKGVEWIRAAWEEFANLARAPDSMYASTAAVLPPRASTAYRRSLVSSNEETCDSDISATSRSMKRRARSAAMNSGRSVNSGKSRRSPKDQRIQPNS
jgi:hypothetical protein